VRSPSPFERWRPSVKSNTTLDGNSQILAMTLMGSRTRSKVSDHLNPIHQPPHYSTYRGRTTETLILPSHVHFCTIKLDILGLYKRVVRCCIRSCNTQEMLLNAFWKSTRANTLFESASIAFRRACPTTSEDPNSQL
jgi:hypothetical protein